MITREQYAQAFIQLMPLGLLFSTDEESVTYKLILAICANYEIFDLFTDNFMREVYPDTTYELLTDWETEFGLPDECSQADDTIETRRKLLLAKYNALGGQTAAYYIMLAAYLGYTITITEFDQFRTNINRINDVLYGEDWQWVWQVNCAQDTGVYFQTNLSTTNEPLIDYGDDRLICFMEKYKPAHTEVIFNFF